MNKLRICLTALALALVLLLALPLAAQAEDYVARDSLCMAVQSGQHNWRLDHYEDATCLHGKIEVDYCSQCGKKCRETISQPGPHTFPDTWDILQTATCTEAGEQIHYCTVCLNASETQPIPALGHSWDGGAVTTDPTCTSDGVRTYTCTRISVSGAPCGATRTESIPALGHQWDGGAVTTQPTCTAPGVKTYTCTRQGASGGPCGATKTESIPALGHAEQAIPGKAATCTETGLTEGSKCSRCGTVLKAQETIPALGHAPQAVPGKAATCTETGLTEGSKCSRCGATLKAQESIPALGHDW
ncbi:MAG: hypothetical protein J5472_08715, partial [Clostridia bacterium]|nr:hypothetical protein [Clostridia bacterium]